MCFMSVNLRLLLVRFCRSKVLILMGMRSLKLSEFWMLGMLGVRGNIW